MFLYAAWSTPYLYIGLYSVTDYAPIFCETLDLATPKAGVVSPGLYLPLGGSLYKKRPDKKEAFCTTPVRPLVVLAECPARPRCIRGSLPLDPRKRSHAPALAKGVVSYVGVVEDQEPGIQKTPP